MKVMSLKGILLGFSALSAAPRLLQARPSTVTVNWLGHPDR